MNPAILNYLVQAQQAGNAQLQDKSSAMPAELSLAMQQGRQALMPSDQQRSNALGHSIINFFSQMAQPGHYGGGLQGALGRAANAFAPATGVYQGHLDKAATENQMLFGNYESAKRQQELLDFKKYEMAEKIKHEKEQQRALLQHQRELAHYKMYLKGMAGNGKAGSPSGSGLIEQVGEAGEDEIPLSELGKEGRAKYEDKMFKEFENIKSIKASIKSAKLFRDVIKRNPRVNESMAARFIKDYPNATSLALEWFYPKEVATDINLGHKYGQDLVTNAIKEMTSGGGGRSAGTDVTKKQLIPSLPNITQNRDSALRVADYYIDKSEKSLKDIYKRLERFKKGYALMKPDDDEDYAPKNETKMRSEPSVVPSEEERKMVESLSDEQLIELANSYKNKKG